MKKKIKLLGQEISFIDQNPSTTKSLLLIHGNSLHAGLFKNLFEAEQFKDYRIVACDLPGHGQSARSDQPGNHYSILNHIAILEELVKALGLTDLVIYGHSLGGHLAINLLPELENIKGLAISGTPPLGLPPLLEKAFLPNPDLMLAFKADLTGAETRELAHAFIQEGAPGADKVQESIQQTDPLARAFIGQSISTELYNDETQLLAQAKIPVAILHGEKDSLANLDYIQKVNIPTLWKNEVQLIPKASHCPFLENKEKFCEGLGEFAGAC
jgi:pimeloyl-ACP methyl ester carboxylesterase